MLYSCTVYCIIGYISNFFPADSSLQICSINHVRCCVVHFRDAGGVQHTLQQLRVLFHPLSSTPTQPTLARKLLSDVVAGALPASDGVGTADVMTAGQYDLQLSGTHTQTQRIPCSKAAP